MAFLSNDDRISAGGTILRLGSCHPHSTLPKLTVELEAMAEVILMALE